MANLHGVETIELTSGTVAVMTIQTAIIGLVGTAPDASTGTPASGTSGTPILNNTVDFAATTTGRSGNVLRVDAQAGLPPSENPAAVPTMAEWDAASLTLKVTLGCDDKGVLTATAADVVAAVAEVQDSKISAKGDGTGLVSPFSLQLAGGEDEPFPLNTPVAVVGTTMVSRLGEKGTLKQALNEINDQRNALTVVVRVAEDAKEEAQRAAVLAGIGMLASAKSVTTYQPRIVIAPGFSEDDAVGKALETVAGKLRAVAYVDCASGATLQEVVQRRQSYGARVELLRPRVQVSDASGQLVYRPYSAFAAGLRARIDYEKGWWWSKSNQDINNILGVEQVDEFILGRKTVMRTCSICRTSPPSSAVPALNTGETVCVPPILSGVSSLFAVPPMLSRTVFRNRCWNMWIDRWTGRTPTTLLAPSMRISASWSILARFSVGGPGWMRS